MKKYTLISLLMLMSALAAKAAVDPNFYVYLCFGQSNMEGNAQPEAMDQTYVDPRFQTLACVNFTSPARTMGQWYTAYPPIVRQGTGLGMADYFGRTMVDNLPENVRVGVVDVAIGGTKIEGFMPEKVEDYLKPEADWLKNYFAAYDNNPYQRLVDMAKIAQQSGVIKGILLHQGESNNCQQDWPQKVKTIYDRLMADLGLNPADVPLLVGEMLSQSAGGACWGHNSMIANLPSVIPNSYVISSANCPGRDDHLHFTAQGYRIMGQRYAKQALHLMGIEAEISEPQVPSGDLTIDHKFSSLEEIGTTPFAIVNETEGKAFYVRSATDNPQFLYYDSYDQALVTSNVAVHFRLETAPVEGCYLLRCIKFNGEGYNFWGSDAYLNSGNFSCFVLGLSDKNGQDIKNGAVWQIEYVDGRGFSLKNIGTGRYFRDTQKAEYESPTYFTFCTLKNATTAISPIREDSYVADEAYYDLSGRRLYGRPTQRGIYVHNGRKIVVK